ncbi:MAG: peptide/nickel transport system ATP-binding protein ddpF [Rhodospirillaceae bacterium]|jgi:peptide/nickel transport system ATP-binding protein|nr:peptide/nickel transport system ATP-binding protein ddpF [Rhodospirillaceae bacterium]
MNRPVDDTLLEVRGLNTWFDTGFGVIKAVEDASFTLKRGKTICVVGESGSGKSVAARSILQIVPRPGRIVAGEILLHGSDLPSARDGVVDIARLDPRGREVRSIRGREISMIFQEPMSSLSPVHTIGHQIMEAIRLHRRISKAEARARAIEVLEQVRIPRPRQSLDSYAFEFSGGMRQRAMTAMALACEPKLLIADEPTTALDVTTQAEILDLIKELQARYGMSVMFITHDMGVVAEIADEVVVMQLGKVVEQGPVDAVFHAPQHPYTRRLLASVLKLESRAHRVAEAAAAPVAPSRRSGPVLRIEGLSMHFQPRRRLFRRAEGDTVKAVDDVSFELFRGETLGIVGESGSGKTTLGRCVLRVLEPSGGKIRFQSRASGEVDLAALPNRALKPYWREIRMVFQDPFSSLNPRMTVFQIISEPLVNNGVARGSELQDRVATLMLKVGLSPDMLRRYPHAFSGGQRQRIGIARAIALEPQLIVADEATSALDVSLRAQMLDLLLQLREDLGLSYLFISHDISVVRYMCDRVAVMHLGKVVEIGEAEQVCNAPRHPYTQSLISAVPRPDPRLRGTIQRIRYQPASAGVS